MSKKVTFGYFFDQISLPGLPDNSLGPVGIARFLLSFRSVAQPA